MSLDPHGYLASVHPDLCKVLHATPQSPVPFQITYGIRTLTAERAACASGHSTTMHSRHLADGAGLACAIDFAALTDTGKIDYAKGHEALVYGPVWRRIKAAADSLGIPVEWGGDWQSFHDWGHVQLPWSKYP